MEVWTTFFTVSSRHLFMIIVFADSLKVQSSASPLVNVENMFAFIERTGKLFRIVCN